MDLDKWIIKNKMTNTAFGELTGVSERSVRRYRKHLVNPSFEVIRRIEFATKSEVTRYDLHKEACQIWPKKNVKKIDTLKLPYKEIVEYLNNATGAAYLESTEATRKLITARFKEGFTLADFKKVIDKKVGEWLTEEKWCQFLRPQTLFGPKFESYLHQKIKEKSKWDLL